MGRECITCDALSFSISICHYPKKKNTIPRLYFMRENEKKHKKDTKCQINVVLIKKKHIFASKLQLIIMERIDNLDRRILEIIMKNARIPSKDVAVECGVSRAAIHQRIQRMIDLEVITGSGYHVNPKVLGYATCTYVGVSLEKGSMYRQAVSALEEIPEVVECHFTTGPYTLLIKLYARDNQHLMELLNDKIQHIEGVMATETLISLEQSINREVPIHYLPDSK